MQTNMTYKIHCTTTENFASRCSTVQDMEKSFTRKNRLHFLGAFAKLRKATIASSFLSVRQFICPHGTPRLPLDGFS